MTDLNEIFAKCKHPDRHQLAGELNGRYGVPPIMAEKIALDFLDRFIVMQRAQPTDPADIKRERLSRAQEKALADLLLAAAYTGDVTAAWTAHRDALHALLRHVSS